MMSGLYLILLFKMKTYKVIEGGIEYDVKEKSNGICWYYKKEHHREKGPAIIDYDGSKFWYKHGKLHREDGPAVIWHGGKVQYWLNDIYYPNVNSPEELIIASIIE